MKNPTCNSSVPISTPMPCDCRVCGNATTPLWQGVILDLNVQYYQCNICDYVQTEQPYWLSRAYAEAVNGSDTGIMARNLLNAKIVLATLLALGKLDDKVVDFAGGYGILVRLLRDYGIDAVWSDQFCKNLLARGFEHQGESAGLVASFEAFEHFVEPSKELDRMLAIAPNVLFSTDIIPSPSPAHNAWWYYGKEHGQHIGFFRIKTLEKLAQDRGKFLLSNGTSYHLITSQPINPQIWKILTKASRLVPLLLRGRLTSKTWTDHLYMAEKTTPSSRIDVSHNKQ